MALPQEPTVYPALLTVPLYHLQGSVGQTKLSVAELEGTLWRKLKFVSFSLLGTFLSEGSSFDRSDHCGRFKAIGIYDTVSVSCISINGCTPEIFLEHSHHQDVIVRWMFLCYLSQHG